MANIGPVLYNQIDPNNFAKLDCARLGYFNPSIEVTYTEYYNTSIRTYSCPWPGEPCCHENCKNKVRATNAGNIMDCLWSAVGYGITTKSAFWTYDFKSDYPNCFIYNIDQNDIRKSISMADFGFVAQKYNAEKGHTKISGGLYNCNV